VRVGADVAGPGVVEGGCEGCDGVGVIGAFDPEGALGAGVVGEAVGDPVGAMGGGLVGSGPAVVEPAEQPPRAVSVAAARTATRRRRGARTG
jgi:hypothetical protein